MVRGYPFNYQVPDTRGWLPWGYLHNLPFPVLTCLPHALIGVSVAQQLLDCTLPACKPCTCPAWRPKKEFRDSHRDISDSSDRGAYTPKARGPGAVRTRQPSLLPRAEGGYHLRGDDFPLLAYQLPGKPEAGARPSQPLRLMNIMRANVFL